MVVRQLIHDIHQASQSKEFLWAPGHEGVEGNEPAGSVGREATTLGSARLGSFSVGTHMLEGNLHCWYRALVRSQEQTSMGSILDPREDLVICTD